MSKRNVCISTRFDRYNIFFELWLKNCLNYEYDIVIFLDGNNHKIIDTVNKINQTLKVQTISIIDISNYGNIYNIDNLTLFKKLFDILYYELQYETIIYTDPDELLLVDTFEKFLETDEKFLSSKGFELFQYIDEFPYDFNKSLIHQRKFGLWSDNSYSDTAPYNKICVFNSHNLENKDICLLLYFHSSTTLFKSEK